MSHALALREPYDLPQTDRYSCHADVIAQVRWMFGVTDAQGADGVRELDRITGRRPGVLDDVTGQHFLILVQDGLRYRTTYTFDIDRLRAERISYVRELAGPAWNARIEAAYTEDRVDDFIARSEEAEVRYHRDFGPYMSTGQVVHEKRMPVFTDIEDALDEGMLVPLVVDTGNTLSTHAVLLYGRNDNYFYVYDAACPTRLSVRMRDWVESRWTGEMVEAVGR